MLKKVIILIAAGYMLVLVLVSGLGLMAIASMERLHSVTDDLYTHPFTVSNAALEMKSALFEIRNKIVQVVLIRNRNDGVEQSINEMNAFDKTARADLDVVKANFLGDMENVRETERSLDQWGAIRAEILRLVLNGEMDEAEKMVKTVGTRKFDEIIPRLDYVISFAQDRAKSFVGEADKEAAAKISLAMWLLAGLIAGISLSGGYVARHTFLLIRRAEQVEEELRKNSAQLEDANKELVAFSYSVSHDLRTPLRAIDGFSRILLDDYTDRLDDEGKRLLNVVRDNTSRMSQLIDDILKFSRAGRVEITFSEIDMEQLAHTVFEELQPSVAGGNLQLEIEPIPPARGDRAMMHQVFVNLLSNAIKFSRSRETARIKVGGSIEGDEAVYYVKDNGVGFDMQYSDKLFGVFQRLHGVDEFEGTGIGLAIVQRIITRHGGRVWAEGKVNEGATIYFALPAKEAGHG
ncbi:MAG: sensor histidine kinase [Gallionellaceae bacterium]